MKLIIEIPEDSYERVMNPDKFYRDIDGEKIRWAVYKGTPIPDNATNGDIIKALFPNAEFSLYSDVVDRVAMNTRVNGTEYEIHFDEDWWDSPYQKGGKE